MGMWRACYSNIREFFFLFYYYPLLYALYAFSFNLCLRMVFVVDLRCRSSTKL